MSIFGDQFASSLGSGAAGLAIGGVASSLGGSGKTERRKNQLRAHKQTKRRTKSALRYGNKLDMQNQKEMFDYRIDQGLEYGMTPYEMFTGPAAGAGGGTSGSGATLGNAVSQTAPMALQAENQARENQRDREANLIQTAMQTDAQRDVAETQAGTQTRGQDLQKEIADNVLSLNKRELEEVKIPQAAAQLGLTQQQLQTEINKTATSSEKFQTAMKQLSMGPGNLLVELTMRDKGISLSDDSFMRMSPEQREQILEELTAMASTLYVEASGFSTVTDAVKDKTTSAADTVADWITDLIVGNGEGIQSTNAPPNPPKVETLGARFSEPGAYGPNMRVR